MTADTPTPDVSGSEREALAEVRQRIERAAATQGYLPKDFVLSVISEVQEGWRPPTEPTAEPICTCAPCPGRGNDGHGLTHCAECCMGTGLEHDFGCPVHEPTAERAGDADDVAVPCPACAGVMSWHHLSPALQVEHARHRGWVVSEHTAEKDAGLQEALDCAREQRDDLLELLDVEREQRAEALNARLTHAEREVLRPVLARYARWPDAHDGPVFEAIEGILAGRRARVTPPGVPAADAGSPE